MNVDVPKCGTCGTRLELRCPCGRPECGLTTPVPRCPKCEKTWLDKWQTAHGVAVCGDYVEKQLRGSMAKA